ncbi:HET-domain-containing protein [Cladorrhinum sp. PSN259]|nr:HET-domain-containing protein [Cladorrhinum sp. PSN259]
MFGYGAPSNLQAEEDEKEEIDDGKEEASSDQADEEVLSPVETYPTILERSLTLEHNAPGSSKPADAIFEPDIICEECQNAFPAEGHDQHRQGNHTLRVDVANPTSCRLCEALINFWAPESYENRYLELEVWFDSREGYFYGVLDVVFRPKLQFSQAPPTARFGFQLFNDTFISRPRMPSFIVDLPSSTRLEHSEEQINGWLNACEEHARCNKQLSRADFVPSRLIEISRDHVGNISIRLRSRSDLNSSVKYATLSHCWGDFMPLRLEQSKIGQFRDEIPWNKISPVFRDAISVSVALDIWYIWIDSLCIIQDSEKDWEAESAMMCDVYSRCHLNIAADASKDGSQGLFRERNPTILKPIHIVVKAHGLTAKDSTPFSAINPGNYLLVDLNSWKEEIDSGPLGKRGWVIQERALSPRTIHFGRNQVAWECRHLSCSEVFRSGFLRGTIQRKAKGFITTGAERSGRAMEIYRKLKGEQDEIDREEEEFDRRMTAWRDPSSLSGENSASVNGSENDCKMLAPRRTLKATSSLPYGVEPYDLLVSSPGFLMSSRKDIHRKWCDIVRAYTECKLSYGSDKLVAIAGLAQMISGVMKCQYLAGLWRKDLEHQLLWKVISPSPAAPRDGTRGPSWSWASVDGGVEWERWYYGIYGGFCGRDSDMIEWLSRIQSVQVSNTTDKPFGQVSSGSLVITGPLKVLNITKDTTNMQPKPDILSDALLVSCHQDVDIFWDTKESHEKFANKRDAIWQYKTYRAAPPRHRPSSGDVFFMPLRIMNYDHCSWDYEFPMLQGLLLLPCPGTRGTYRRIGQLTVSEHKATDEFLKGEKWPFQSRTEILDNRLYQSVGADGEYTIQIV